MTVEAGEVAKTICDRALLADLVVVHLAHPPSSQPLLRLGSGFSALIRKCPRPILAVAGPATALDRALLAYDGSPKAKEALFVAAYLAARWPIPLTVLTVEGADVDAEDMLEEAGEYLHTRGVHADEAPAERTGVGSHSAGGRQFGQPVAHSRGIRQPSDGRGGAGQPGGRHPAQEPPAGTYLPLRINPWTSGAEIRIED